MSTDGVEVWRDPDTGRAAPKPQPLPAGEAARRLGLKGDDSLAVRCTYCCDLGCAACGVGGTPE
jgi:hypothetical protein